MTTKFTLKQEPECFGGPELVAYLYNEMSADQMRRLETHFKGCSNCVDAFAELSFSRYSVYEWQQAEFAKLPTPRFSIPYADAPIRAGLFNAVRDLFSVRPQYAFASAAFVLIFAAGVYFALLPGSDLATVDPPIEVVTEEITAAPQVEIEGLVDSATYPESMTSVRPVNDSGQKQRVVPREGKRVPRPQRVTKRTESAVRSSQPPPRLNDFQDLSDDGLRLADLVADLDTRD